MRNTGTNNKTTALYCRLSLDDGNMGESMSITSQKAILEYKAKELGITDYQFYVDDGYSGTNFNRPDFQRMIRDIEEGLIGCVITKDLSRLGRNYIESGTYIEIFFPQHGVRYIAVNDGVDSANTNEMDITPFKNILNEFYSRDISKKVKTARAIRASQGKFIGVTAPFGLKKDPNDKNHLIIDEETAPTVRYIYELALKGYGNNKIGKVLYAEKIKKPAYYKQEYFGKFLKKPEDAYDWQQETILRILRNPIYKGYMWVCKYNKTNFKQRTKGYIPFKERTIIPTDHEAIVSEQVWDTVQDIIDRHSKIKPCTSGYNNMFRGLLKCDTCGASMLVHTDSRTSGKPLMNKTYFLCRTYRTKGTGFCSQHRINAPDLEDAVLNDIRFHADRVINNREEFVGNIMQGLRGMNQSSQEQTEKRIAELKAKSDDADKRYIKLYDDRTQGIVSDSKFKLLSARIEEEQTAFLKEIEELEKSLKETGKDIQAVETIADEFAECTQMKELSTEHLNRLIEKIEVSNPETTANGEKTQKVRIFYKFVGVIE
jgi:DNA invertase Pin-like site-specific DNA recombinase